MQTETHTREEMINQQSAANSTSSRKQKNLFDSYIPTRHLSLDRQTTTATESGTPATTTHAIYTHFSKQYFRGKQTVKSAIRRGMHATTGFFREYCLPTSTFAWCSLTTGGICINQPWRPRGRSHSHCCCVAFPGARKCNHDYLLV